MLWKIRNGVSTKSRQGDALHEMGQKIFRACNLLSIIQILQRKFCRFHIRFFAAFLIKILRLNSENFIKLGLKYIIFWVHRLVKNYERKNHPSESWSHAPLLIVIVFWNFAAGAALFKLTISIHRNFGEASGIGNWNPCVRKKSCITIFCNYNITTSTYY